MNIQKLAFDLEAIKIIQAVLDGTMSPLEGATSLSAYWFPKESMQKGELPFMIQTRQDSLNQLDHTVTDLYNQGKKEGARRLAELNWILARRSNNHELMVQCAASLAQMMSGDPAAIRDRLELLEFAVPEVLKWDRPTLVKAIMLAHLADARFTASHPRQRETIATCQQALSLGKPLGDFWYGRLNFIAGTEYNNIGASIEDLQSSIEYLETALKYYCADNFPTKYASTLNNLGNSYRDLGKKLRDRELLQQAIDCYDKALPFRKNVHLRERTLGNKRRTLELLETLNTTRTEATPQSSSEHQVDFPQLAEVENLMRAGDDRRFQGYTDTDQQESYQKAAAVQYIQAMKKLGRNGPGALRAELFHRLTSFFIESTDDDALWTGLCFTGATQRLSGDWAAVSRARVSYHRGMMLMKIGYPDKIPYLSLAEALIRKSLPLLQQHGKPGEFEQANKYLIACTSLLAACGVAEAEDRAIALHAQKELARLESENNISQSDILKVTYQTYLSIMKEVATVQLKDLLGKLGLEVSKIIANNFYDEFNHAEQLTLLAAKHRDIGDLSGALSLIKQAEEYAQHARFSAPTIWCKVAEFYASLPMQEEALHCINKAQNLMDLAADDDEAVLPGDESGRWIPEFGLGDYREEINRTKAVIDNAPIKPKFNIVRTAQLLIPENESLCGQLEQKIRDKMAATDLFENL